MPDVSISVSLKDRYSDGVKAMQSANKAFDKSLDEVNEGIRQNDKRILELRKSHADLKTQLDAASNALSAARKEYKKSSSPENFEGLKEAHQRYEQLKDSVNDTAKALKAARQANQQLNDELGRIQNRATDPESLQSGPRSKGVLSQLGKSGFWRTAADLALPAFSAYVSSTYGEAGTSMFSSMLSGAGQGAAIGSMIAPGWGTFLGGLAGGAAGFFGGHVEQFQRQDDSFRSVVQQRYEQNQAEQQETLASGSALAAQRETSLISFSTLFGDEQLARDFTEQMRAFANSTPFLYDELANLAKTLKTYGYQPEELMPAMQSIGDAGAALGMESSDMVMAATALGRMRSSNKTSAEYLNLLLERGIPVYDYLAQSLETSKEQVMKMVSDGLIPGEKAARAIADYMAQDFAGSMEGQSKTFAGLESTLQGLEQEMDAAMGQGYNDARKQGMEKQIAYLQGETGQGIQQANYLIGQWKASLENQKEQIRRDMESAVMSGLSTGDYGPEIAAKLEEMRQQYKELASSGKEEAGAEMGALLAQAQVMAENEYLASQGAQLEKQAQMGLIQSIRNDTALREEYYNAGYEMQLEFSKGIKAAQPLMTAAMAPAAAAFTVHNEKDEEYNRFLKGQAGYGINENSLAPDVTDRRALSGSHAAGLRRVPYDDYPALLHQDERILTAAEARQYNLLELGGTQQPQEEGRQFRLTLAERLDSGQGSGEPFRRAPSISIAKLADSIVVQEQADIDRIAQTLVSRILQARLVTI